MERLFIVQWTESMSVYKQADMGSNPSSAI